MNALLFEVNYKHGLRSMEAILDMSLLSECKSFEQAALPSKAQMRLHADPAPSPASGSPAAPGPTTPPSGPSGTPAPGAPDEPAGEARADASPLTPAPGEDVDFDRTLETIARAIHERYRRSNPQHLPEGDPALFNWEELAEDFKASNREQAAQIPVKLKRIGYHFKAGEVPPPGNPPLDADEIEVLAEMEHDRWCEEKSRQGWQPGPVRDPEAKLNPYLCDWDKLPEEVKELNRRMVRDIPELMAEAGFQIYRTQ